MLPDLAGLIGALVRAEIRFVAIGGIAVAAHRIVFRVCSRAHLIEMKRARGSALDQADLERLLAAS
jgi:hypothetical protein